jgi:hypothetical protein
MNLARAQLATLLLMAACVPNRALVPIRDGVPATLGCYFLAYTYWSPATSIPDSDWWRFTPPAFIELHATGQASPRWPAVTPSLSAKSFSAKWHIFGNDSLIISWEHSSLAIHLRPVGDSLIGIAYLGLDRPAGGALPSAHVRGRQLRCA